jgi:hypothetical protein
VQDIEDPFAQIFPMPSITFIAAVWNIGFWDRSTIDIETAPLTPSIARRFTSARSSDGWCWGLVHVIRVHLVADFGDVSAVSRRFFPQ